MTRKLTTALLLTLALAVAVSGCSSIPFLNSDQKRARKAIEAIYAGSLDSIKDSFGPQMTQTLPMISQAGATLKQQFGEVKSLEEKSSQPVQVPNPSGGTTEMTQQIWTVTAEKGSFQLLMYVNDEGKIEGLWAAPNPSGTPAPAK